MITIGNKQLCEYCLSENCGEPCRVCGFDKNNFKKEVGVLVPGSILSGRYIVGKHIGRGGFGITYLAYDTKLEKKVALKEYYPSSLSARDEDGCTVVVTGSEDMALYKNGMEKFYEEASLVSTFNGNPSIVSVYEFFYENDTAYFVMELLRGVSLKAYIAEHGCLSSEQMLYIADKVSGALMAAHSTNTLHRDISPDNIMICEDGKVKLIDFGAARQVAADNPRSMSVILKQGFAPLEQYQRRGNQGPWTDLYSLGATLYYAATKVCLDDPMTRLEDDSEFQANNYNIEPQLWEVIRHSLNVKIDDRYKDAFEFRAALNQIAYKPQEIKAAASEPVQAPEPVLVPAAQTAASARPAQPTASPTKYVQSTPAQTEPVKSVKSVEPVKPVEPIQQAQEPFPKTDNAQPAAAEKKSKKKVIMISAIALASVAIIGVVVYLLFLRGKGSQTVTIGKKTFSTSEEYVDLSNMGLMDKDISDLKYFTNLKSINLDGNVLTDISVLANIPTLEEIVANSNYISDISFLKDLKNVKTVVMNDNKIYDISVFREFTTIEILWLNDNDINDISPIEPNKGLVEVGFCDSYIGDSIWALEGMDNLVILELTHCGITDITPLATCTALEELYIRENRIEDYSPIEGLDLSVLDY